MTGQTVQIRIRVLKNSDSGLQYLLLPFFCENIRDQGNLSKSEDERDLLKWVKCPKVWEVTAY